jgi:hypothetical protein
MARTSGILFEAIMEAMTHFPVALFVGSFWIILLR